MVRPHGDVLWLPTTRPPAPAELRMDDGRWYKVLRKLDINFQHQHDLMRVGTYLHTPFGARCELQPCCCCCCLSLCTYWFKFLVPGEARGCVSQKRALCNPIIQSCVACVMSFHSGFSSSGGNDERLYLAQNRISDGWLAGFVCTLSMHRRDFCVFAHCVVLQSKHSTSVRRLNLLNCGACEEKRANVL